ncbi:MAG TPA: nitroreductase [Clostridiales bacterium]|nr:nitroreductase [Clostridiales bacterium]
MEVQKAIQQRRSVRRYKDAPVEEEKLTLLLEAARLAPTGSNTQSGRFIVIRDDKMRTQVAQVSHDQKWMKQAPLFIACVADIRARIPSGELTLDEQSPQLELKQCIRDVSIQGEHIVLQAEALGLSSCWIAWYTQNEIRQVLEIPEDKYVVAVLVIGYADETPAARPRKSLDEIVYHEKWQG